MNADSNAVPMPKWTSKQVLVQSAICLLLGLVCGYFIRGSQSASAARVAPQAATASAPQAEVEVTPEQLKHMADKQAEPLLAQLKSQPNDPALLAQLGQIYYATRNFSESVDYYNKSLAQKDDAAIRIELGRAYFYAGDADKSIAEFEKVVKADPGNANALYNLGLIRWQAKFDVNGAIADWQQLLKKNPNHPHRAEVEQLIARAQQHSAMKP